MLVHLRRLSAVRNGTNTDFFQLREVFFEEGFELIQIFTFADLFHLPLFKVPLQAPLDDVWCVIAPLCEERALLVEVYLNSVQL